MQCNYFEMRLKVKNLKPCYTVMDIRAAQYGQHFVHTFIYANYSNINAIFQYKCHNKKDHNNKILLLFGSHTCYFNIPSVAKVSKMGNDLDCIFPRAMYCDIGAFHKTDIAMVLAP